MPLVVADDDLYAVLGLSPTASNREIDNGYRDQMRRWHPDVCRAPGAERRAKAINYARDILRNPSTRGAYDSLRRRTPEPLRSPAGSEQESPIDKYDLNIRSWSVRAFVWTAKLGPWAFPFWLLEALFEWVLEWFDVVVVVFRFATTLRPWPKALYWIIWELGALTFVVGLLTGVVGREVFPNKVLTVADFVLLLMPAIYFPLWWALRSLLPRVGVERKKRRTLARRD